MPRQARLDSPGTLHHVIVRGIEKRLIMNDECDRAAWLDRMARLAEDLSTPIYAWALMGNHTHILLKSGPAGLSTFMRKLLTGYAVYYNRRHDRLGHLFHNRYKSIIVEEDGYFRELVRYIHLNPLRANIVESLSQLDRYPWTGHSALMGNQKYKIQDTKFVLSFFGGNIPQARAQYRQFVKKGIDLGRQPELVGGGLIRSMGSWSKVKALRRIGQLEKSDTRILGTGAFVEQILKETDTQNKNRFSDIDRESAAAELIADQCRGAEIHSLALTGGSRQRRISNVRQTLACRLTGELGLSFAETARLLGVTTSAVAKIVNRKGKNK